VQDGENMEKQPQPQTETHKEALSGRERLLCVLHKECPDRVPISLFVQEEYLSWFYPERAVVSRVKEAVECANYYDFDIITRENQFTVPFWLKDSYPNWEIEQSNWVDNGIYHRKTSISTPSGVLSQIESGPYNPRIQAGMHLHTSEYFIKEPSDLEVLMAYFPQEKKERIEERHFMASQAASIVTSRGITCPWGVGGVYNMVSSCRDIQELLMDPYIQPDFYRELMQFFTRWIAEDFEKLLETSYDAVGIQGNIANGALVGDAFFREHILPYEKCITNTISDYGKFSIYHNCGNARNLYQCYKDVGMDVWETVAPPPMGDNDLAEAKEFFGSDLILSGNIDQVEFLKVAQVSQIEQRVKDSMDAAKGGGGYIFAASDFLEPHTPEENIRTLVESAKRWGTYQ
jgi:uroporphyrinogen decarboxylase